MILRRATADDAAACARIVDDWFAATDWIGAGPGYERLEAMMRDGFPIREAWIAGEPVAGYLSMTLGGNRIFGLYAAAPGHGVGHALLNHVKQGRDRLHLRSHAPNYAAHRFYDREGFTVTRRNLAGNDGVPEIEMEWRA